MTCEGCGREVTLMDGHFCGQCSSQIAANVNSALEDVSVLTADLKDVFVGKDGLLYIRAEYEGGPQVTEEDPAEGRCGISLGESEEGEADGV